MIDPGETRTYGDDSIHRPPRYGEGDTEARRAAALARSHAERPDRPRSGPLTGADLEEYGARLLSRRQAARAAGTVEQPDTGALRRRLAEQQARRNAQHALLPVVDRFEDYLGAQLGDVPEVVEWAAGVAAGESSDWLLLLGPTGVGKTWQAVAAYRAITHDRGLDGLAITVGELRLRSLPSSPDPVSLRAYERADVLLLDDLANGLSEWEAKILFQLINARSASNRLTIITSNLRREEIRDVFGDRLASRIAHRLRIVALNGADRRLHH